MGFSWIFIAGTTHQAGHPNSGVRSAYPFPLDLPILKSTQKSSAPTQKALAEQDNMFRLGLAAQLCYLQH